MKVWAKTRPNKHFTIFHSPNISHAVNGFRELGAEIVTYNKIDEIYDKVTKDDIVLDYIDQCKTIFHKFGVVPDLPDYPEVLKPFLGRTIFKDTINHINSDPSTWGVFVKPVKDKVFTGRVINSPKDLVGCGSCYENYEVLCSEVLDIKREWRGFVYYDKLIDIRPYTGDYHYNKFFNEEFVDDCMDCFKDWDERPVACSIDFAVIETKQGTHKTIFLELNDAYALGNYGLNHIDYAKMISARWSQLLGRKDEFHFT